MTSLEREAAGHGRVRRALDATRAALPRGGVLSCADFASRQRLVVVVLVGHLAGILVFGISRGVSGASLVVSDGAVFLFTVAAWQPHLLPARARAAVSAVGLLLCSAILVQISGGSIEMHFHFFVMVALIALYQDWVPFLIAIGFVALHHGVIGVVAAHNVYDHHSAWTSPWRWAAIHAAFVLAASAAQVVSWRMVEVEHDRANASLQASERRFRSLIEHSLDAVAILDAAGVITYESESAEHVLGFAAGERQGIDSLTFAHPDDRELAAELIASVLERPDSVASANLRAQHADGSWRWLDIRLSNMLDDPDVAGLVVNYRDVTERRSLEDELARQAFVDSLTGLANRALFLDRLDHALAAHAGRPGRWLGILFVDIDDFKTINDALGHGVGDDVLRSIGGRLAGAGRRSDTCARLGGDEFAILIEDLAHPAEAEGAAHHILDVMRSPFIVDGQAMSLTASIGIATTGGGGTAEQVLRNADLAMYKAKRTGKGRCEVFETGLQQAVTDRLALREDLRRGIDNGEIVTHYQPIVDLLTGEITGAEALVRWQHPTRGLVPPAVFIDIAEETGLIVPLGEIVLNQACADTAALHRQELTVSVNLSSRQLTSPTIVADVAGALDRSGLAPERLVLEITESVFIGDPDSASETLADLKALGVRVALDDFGTGFSSLSYLARFPVDILKIDRSFVHALSADKHDQQHALVDAIIDMSTALNLQVTAEGIETAEQASTLVALGCSHGQGYLYGKPTTLDDYITASETPATRWAATSNKPLDHPATVEPLLSN